MSSYHYNSSNSSSGSSNSNFTPSSSSYSIPASQRPDGSYRDERRVRPGYTPEAETSRYVSPPYRREYNSSYSSPQGETNTNTAGSNDRVDSWGDEECSDDKTTISSASVDSEPKSAEVPAQTKTEVESDVVVNEKKDDIKPVEVKKEENKLVEETASSEALTWGEVPEENNTNTDKNTTVRTSIPEAQVVRAPSQLASAIDGALDVLSLGTGGSPSNSTSETSNSMASRPMGRFAAQIANDEREGRTYTYRRYDNNYTNNGSYSNSYNQNNGGGSSNGQNYNNSYNRGYYNRDGYTSANNPNTTLSYANNTTSNNLNACTTGTTASRPTTWSRSGSNSDLTDNRFENEFKVFLEELTTLRKEMAIINAKIEYIRYTKSRDPRELTTAELERIALEPGLIARINAIFDAIDALNSKQ